MAAEELGLLTSPYQFADNFEDYKAIHEIGMPCVVKPIMSSSGKGQTVVKSETDLENSWNYAQEGGRAGKGKVIIEGFVNSIMRLLYSQFGTSMERVSAIP